MRIFYTKALALCLMFATALVAGCSKNSDPKDPTPNPDPTPEPNVKVYPSSIDVDDTYYVSVGGTTQIYASVLPSNATDKSLRYSSNNPSVATVSASGVITGIKQGSTTMTIMTSNNKSASINVIVE